MNWEPTKAFLRGKVVKPFLPFEKHPDLINDNLKNLYPGDEVYIFETTHNSRWARGHTISKPFPSDFTITSVNLDEIPRQNIDIVVFPLKYIQIVEEVALSSTVDNELKDYENGTTIPSIQDFEMAHRQALEGASDDKGNSFRARIPLLPITTFDENNDLIAEMKYALELLTSHIFALYSIGEFRLFHKLCQIYYSLDETRLKLLANALCSSESQVAKATAILLLNKIPKMLASHSERFGVQLFDLSNEKADSSGYKAILARDALTGNLLSNSNAIPPRIALNQVLCSLSPEFPINAHVDKLSYSLTPQPNQRLVPKPVSHLLIDFKSLQGSSTYQPTGSSGMVVYFYIRYDRVRLTETFAVKVNAADSFIDSEEMQAALFKNIPSNEITSGNVYLVAVVTEEIELNTKDRSKKAQEKSIKKGVAAGVADISKLFTKEYASKASDEQLFKIRLFGSYMDQNKDSKNYRFDSIVNNGFGEVVDRIIEGSKTGIAINPRAETLTVSIKDFKHQIKTVLDADDNTPKSIPRISAIYFDPLTEKYERLYLRMGKVTLLDGGASEDLLTIEASSPDNSLISFSKASNQSFQKKWQFLTVCPNESIGEIIKVHGVELKNDDTTGDEFILFSLYSNGSLIAQGKLIYKSKDQLVRIDSKNHIIELKSVFQGSAIASVKISTDYVGKTFNYDLAIDNVFQYEKFFQNGDEGILQLNSSLVTFKELKLHQLVKYFKELLKDLFSIVEISTKQEPSPSIDELKWSTFIAIVHLLDVIFGKQSRYLYLLDTFMEKQIRLPPVGAYVLECISIVLSQAEKKWDSSSRALCRVSPILMKFAVLSMDGVTDLGQYFKSLIRMSMSGSYFLSIDSEVFVTSQVIILEILDDVLSRNLHIGGVETLKFFVNYLDSVGIRGLGIDKDIYSTNRTVSTEKDHRIILSKLLLIYRLFNTFVINDAPSRKLLISKAVEWAMQILQGPIDVEASRLACGILNAVCSLIWKTVFVEGHLDEMPLCYSLSKFLPAISRAFVRYNKFTRGNESFKPKRTFSPLFPTEYPFKEISVDPVVGEEVLVEVLVEMAVVFCFIAKIGKESAGEAGFKKVLDTEVEGDFFDSSKYLLNEFESKDLISLISGVNLIRQGKFIPEDKWLSLNSLFVEGCLVSLELIKPLLYSYYIPGAENPENFEKVLWGNYLRCLLRLAVVTPVSIEYLSDGPKKACYQITGNIRDRIARILNESWDNLAWDSNQDDYVRFNVKRFGGYQLKFINTEYDILRDLMLFALQKDSECQAVAVKILWSIMVSEFIAKDSIVDVEKACLLGLKEIYYRNGYKPSSIEQQKFIDGLRLTIRLDGEDEAFKVVYKFVETLEGFLNALNEYNTVPVGSEFNDDRSFHLLNIKAYLKNANKPELFDSFINTMYEENIKKQDYIQAALSLELLASTCTWDHQVVLPASLKPKFPQQSSFERKETLFNMIAKNYIRGNSLERATDTYNELLDSYNLYTYDLKSFANVHGKLAKLYLDLETSDKLSPSFFKVAFIGAGFPKNIRGKMQIYEGLPFEHITSIHERLLKLYPGVRIITDDAEAQKLMERVQTGRYLYVCSVEPVNEISDKLLNASVGARQYARNKNLRFFTSMRRLPGATSVYDLWTEETTYETFLSFPTLMNRSDIKSNVVVKLSPLDNAIRTVVRKNNDLLQSESMLTNTFKENSEYSGFLGDLSRLLAGTVDSPVNGGVGQYRNFIYDNEYRGDKHLASRKLLSDAFNELSTILNRCLHLHAKLVTPDMRASQEALVDLYKKNFAEEIESLNISTDYSTAYNNGIQYTSPVASQNTGDKPSISTGSGLSGKFAAPPKQASSNNGSSSSISSRSNVSGNGSVANGSSISVASQSSKRTALNWRNIVRRN